MRNCFWCTVLLIAAGCAGDDTMAGESALGITDLEVRATASTLDIVGRDEAGIEIASLHVTRGRIVLAEDGREVDGRRLTVNVLGQQATHESEGVGMRVLPPFRAPEQRPFNDFLLDPRVSAALGRWQIELDEPIAEVDELAEVDPPPTEAEQPYGACTYPAGPNCGQTSCVQSKYMEPGCILGAEQALCCAKSKTANRRICGLGPFNPCGPEGNGGCAVCWWTTYTSSCSATNGPQGPWEECGPYIYRIQTLFLNYN